MIVVADSGSTKTDWRFIDENGNTWHSIKTIGFNPYFQHTEFIASTLTIDFAPVLAECAEKVTQVYYYGAGCSSEDKSVIVYKALKSLFPSAQVNIKHDLLGASRAALGDKEGMACILGTGANSCIWNGMEVIANIPSHGYIFGDEGSGAYLGKEVLKLYLNNEMEAEMRKKFDEEFSVTEHDILERTYKQPNPNVYLASFARFYTLFPESKELSNIIRYGFNDFFHRRVMKYADYAYYDLGFIGSIAYHFQEELRAIASIHGLKIGSIERCPIDRLVIYHVEKSAIIS